jgi:hypothetical protein
MADKQSAIAGRGHNTMHWQLTIPLDSPGKSSDAVTVEADNWFTAFKEGLKKHGIDSALVSSLSCAVQPDKSVKIKDFVSRRVYVLRPMDATLESDPLSPMPQDVSGGKHGTSPLSPSHDDGKSVSMTPPPDHIAIDDKMIQAFKRMQDIFDLHTHDQVADFGLSLAMDLIPCETGRCMLLTPGKYELYVASAKGAEAAAMRTQKIDIDHGIVGFATRMSAVVVVSEPENDPRFEGEYDAHPGYKTKNLLCAPIQYEGHTTGAVLLINSSHSADFTQSDANTLSYVSGALAEYIEKSLPSREADFAEREFSS